MSDRDSIVACVLCMSPLEILAVFPKASKEVMMVMAELNPDLRESGALSKLIFETRSFNRFKFLLSIGFVRPAKLNIAKGINYDKYPYVDFPTDFTMAERWRWLHRLSRLPYTIQVVVDRSKPFESLTSQFGDLWNNKCFFDFRVTMTREFEMPDGSTTTLNEEGQGRGLLREAVSLACGDISSHMDLVNDFWILRDECAKMGMLCGLAFIHECRFARIPPCVIKRAITETEFVAEDLLEYDPVHYDTIINATPEELEDLCVPSIDEYVIEMRTNILLFQEGFASVFPEHPWRRQALVPCVFTWEEVYQAVVGSDEFEVWKSSTTNNDQQHATRLWQALAEEPQDRRDVFYRFWSGSSKYPLSGKPPQILFQTDGDYITAMTCARTLFVPCLLDFKQAISAVIDHQVTGGFFDLQ